MAGSDENPPVVSDLATDQPGDKIVASTIVGNKDTDASDGAVVEGEAFHASALPPGTTDPVYEAKARVLNHAVRNRSQP